MNNFIIEKIKQSPNNLISYAEFIELALYHPTMGYYMREEVKIGKNGDFFTVSNVSTIFGNLFSKWFLKQVTENGINPSVCEIGAGNGRFAKAFLDTWQKQSEIPLTYNIIETSPYHRQLQNERLSIGKNVKQLNKLSDLFPFNGLVFSNELFDALPVHVVENYRGQLYEVMIGENNNQLQERRVLLSNPKIQTFLDEQKISLLDNQRIEIPLAMDEMLESIGNAIESGLIVTIDYGYTNEEWMSPERKLGSLRGYYKHQMISNVLLHPSEMDITSHIHFDRLINKGNEIGLQFLLKKRQDEFLISVGILQELEENFDTNPFSEKSKRNRAIRSLIMPGISSYFHIVLQEKNTGLTEQQLF